VNSMLKVARYHLMTPVLLLGLPWAALAFAFAVNAARGGETFRAGASSIFVIFFITGVQRIGQWLPFGLALGMTRRSFYAGTALLGAVMSLASGLVLAALQAIERATNGWGMSVTFFRMPFGLNGPWYDTWLTSSVGLAAAFAYGMWYGIVNCRWGGPGVLGFIAAQVLVALALTLPDPGRLWLFVYSWSYAGRHLARLSALDLTGVIAVLAALFLVGGHLTIRRVPV
jgi:hypothetical protein